jgi:hypothetical protein
MSSHTSPPFILQLSLLHPPHIQPAPLLYRQLDQHHRQPGLKDCKRVQKSEWKKWMEESPVSMLTKETPWAQQNTKTQS